MVLGCINRTAWGTKLLDPHGSLGPPCGSDQFMSLTKGTALLFESKWVLYPTFGSPPAPTTYPTPLPPAFPYRLNLELKKNYLKTSSI